MRIEAAPDGDDTTPREDAFDAAADIELSVVIPCLNEADTIEACVRTALDACAAAGIAAEVVVADNGSSDDSAARATSAGARVVAVPAPGYGSALSGGIAAARGRYVVMGDGDGSYDFAEIPRFVERLREGYDLVQGCRLPAGGGRVMPGAMPFLHRWLGNPLFTFLVRLWFGAPVRDVNCGLRAFSKAAYERLGLRAPGMEFAVEMIVRATVLGERIGEIPITLSPDGRVAHPPHLNTFRDGWRTLRLFLLYSPRWLYLVPGTLLMLLGAALAALALPGMTVAGVRFDLSTLLFASLFLQLGYTTVLFAVVAKGYAVSRGLLPPGGMYARIARFIKLEYGLVGGTALMAAGAVPLAMAVLAWRAAGFGDLDASVVVREVVTGTTLMALGFQTLIASFLYALVTGDAQPLTLRDRTD